MSKLIDDLKRILYEHWATGMGLVLTLVLSSGILIWTLAEINFGDVTPGEWLVVIVLLTVLVLVWWRYRLPRARHDRIGFGVAIELADSPKARDLREDLVRVIHALVEGSEQFRYNFQFIEFPQPVCRRVTDAQEASLLLQKSNCKFLDFRSG